MNKILRSFLLLIVVLVLLLLLWPALRNQLLKLSDTLAEQTAARVVALLPIEKFEYRAQRIVNALDKSVQDNRLEIRRMEPDFLVAFPLMFDNAGLVSEGEQLDFRKGKICPAAAHEERLRALVETFKPCAEGSVVRFTVEGHSSTVRFRDADGTPLAATDQLNLAVANERAKGVGAYLRMLAEESGAGRGFEIRIVEWETFEQMRRPYLDNSEQLMKGDDRGALNRTVLVELHEAGACDAPLAKRKPAGLPTPAGSGETPCYAP